MDTVNTCASGAVVPEDYIPCYNQEVARVQSADFVRVYATYPEYYQNTLITEATHSPTLGVPTPVVGGYIINPVRLSVSYRAISGETLRPTATFTGPSLTTYAVEDFLLLFENPDVSDLAAAYYTTGATPSIQPYAIDGYVTPPGTIYATGGRH